VISVTAANTGSHPLLDHGSCQDPVDRFDRCPRHWLGVPCATLDGVLSTDWLKIAHEVLQILSLRQMLTMPYVVLVLLLAAAIGGLSYSAGRVAVDTLSNQLLSEMVYRIAQAAERHVFGASAVLETAFPTGVAAPANINDDLDNLRTRFWLATSVHRDPTTTPTTAIVNGRLFRALAPFRK
jgi:hypothetical protein